MAAVSSSVMMQSILTNMSPETQENGQDQEDCQMQPLDLSCPKQIQTSSNTTTPSDCENEEVMSPIDGSLRSSSHRPRSSSGNSDESDRDLSLNLTSNHHSNNSISHRFDKFSDSLSNPSSAVSRRSSDEQLVKNAAALLRNYLPSAAAASAAGLPPVFLDGPARKRFLTNYHFYWLVVLKLKNYLEFFFYLGISLSNI